MTAPVHEGQVLAGKYRVESVLGRGGMGVVVAAQHLHLGQRVALKILLPEACAQVEGVTRFLREARAVARLESQHVARVTDVGTLESGAPFLVMEYLRGADLGVVLRQRGKLPIGEAVAYLLQACEAIAEAHALGIVHRDLKPSNLFLTQRLDGSPLVKVLDFGVSKALDPEVLYGSSANVTSANMILGSPHYMSPEQVKTPTQVDTRTDIWSLGMILYELVTGVPAFEAESVPALLVTIVGDPPTPLRARLPDAPVALETIITWCLQKDRERRCPNVAELARALEPFAEIDVHRSVERIARILGPVPSARFTPVTLISTNKPPLSPWDELEQRKKRRRKVAVLAIVAVAGFALGMTLWFRERPQRNARDAPLSASPMRSPASAPAVTSATSAESAVSASDPVVAPVTSASSQVSPLTSASVSAPSKASPPRTAPKAKPRPKRDLFEDAK